MDNKLLKKMLYKYLEDKREEVRQAIETEDIEEVKSLAHKIKGNSGSIALGLNFINEIGRALEKAAAENNFNACRDAFVQLDEEVNKITAE